MLLPEPLEVQVTVTWQFNIFSLVWMLKQIHIDYYPLLFKHTNAMNKTRTAKTRAVPQLAKPLPLGAFASHMGVSIPYGYGFKFQLLHF